MAGWNECPEKARRSPHWQGVIRLYNLSRIAPLEGWGHEYTPGAEDGVMALHDAIERYRVQRMQEAQGGQHGSR